MNPDSVSLQTRAAAVQACIEKMLRDVATGTLQAQSESIKTATRELAALLRDIANALDGEP